VPITELRRLGVTVNGFEKEVIRADQRALSECR
jgi:hypothetical protein